MTYYLSGPMSGLPDFNFPAFTFACDALRSSGLTIVSPHEKDSEGDTARPWADYLREDIALMMAGCQALILLPGWPDSSGAKLELSLALALNWPVYFYVPQTHDLFNMRNGKRMLFTRMVADEA